MPKYEIFAGLSGSFGGAQHQGTYRFDNEDAALEYAYQAAVTEYESYGGLHGLMNKEMYLEDNPDDPNLECYEEVVEEDMQSWIEYYVEPAE